jgi:poly(glycerol-phosphate) alpha-glucosyltransferase
MPTKVVFLSGSRSSAAGGIFEVERAIADRLRSRYGIAVDAAGLLDAGIVRDANAWGQTPVHCFPIVGPKSFGYSPKLKEWLLESEYDLLHLHNLWMYTSVLALEWHKRKGKPFIVSPHGMLEPWALRNSGWKKRIVELLYESRMLKSAAIVHAFHDKDVRDYRAYGLVNPIAVIPNGVSLPNREVQHTGRLKKLLFLGRIHPKKGLHALIEAWSMFSNDQRMGWKLAIAGWGDAKHVSELSQCVSALDSEKSIELLGPVYGSAKDELLESVGGFVLPSRSEGLPMAVLEAWAFKLPVLITEMCNLPDGFAESAAIRISPNSDSIAEGLSTFFNLSDEHRVQMGANGRRLVEKRFTWDHVLDQYRSVYQWMLGETDKPDFVRSDDAR